MNQIETNSEMPGGLRIFIGRLRRGGIIFHSLYLLFAGCAGGVLFVALVLHWSIAWAALFLILGLICRLTVLLHVRQRYLNARKVADDPQVVYWGHAIDRQGQATDEAVTESSRLKLHLKSGAHLTVEAIPAAGISQQQLREVVSWLRERNPSILWGSYDKPDL